MSSTRRCTRAGWPIVSWRNRPVSQASATAQKTLRRSRFWNAMADNSDEKRPLTLGGRPSGKLELRKPIETGSVRQSFPHGRSKTVQVEVRRKRAGSGTGLPERPEAAPVVAKETPKPAAPPPSRRGVVLPHGLTPEEAARRARALNRALKAEEQAAAEARAAIEREQELAKAQPVAPPPRPTETPKVEARNADEQRAEQR